MSAKHAFVVSSGMGALDIITRMLRNGDEIVAVDDLYGGILFAPFFDLFLKLRGH